MTAHSIGRRAAWLLPLALAHSGCAAHVVLQAPPANAPAEVRLAAYAQLSPASYRVVRYSDSSSSATYSDSVELNDGRRVRYLADLRPVVADDSRAAADLAEASEYGAKANWAYAAGIAGLVASMVLMVNDLRVNGPDQRGAPFYVGAGLGIGGLISLPIAMTFGARSNEAGIAAAKHYDDGLQRRLSLCKTEQGVAPCP